MPVIALHRFLVRIDAACIFFQTIMADASFSNTELPKGFLPHEIASQSVKTPLKNCKKQRKGFGVVFWFVFFLPYRIERAGKKHNGESKKNSACHSPHLKYCGSWVHQYRMPIHKNLYLVAGCCRSCTP